MQWPYPLTNEAVSASDPDGIADQAFDRFLHRTFSDFPVVRSLWDRYRAQLPLSGARIGILCPAVAHFSALAALLRALGARVSYVAERSGDMDDLVAFGATTNESEGLSRGCDEAGAILDWPDGSTPGLIIDYDGRVARLVHRGVAVEADPSQRSADPDEAELDRSVRLLGATHRLSFSAIATNVVGLCVCTASGAASLRHIETAAGLLFPVIDVSAAHMLGPAPDRSHLATATLDRLLAGLALAQIELFTNGASYRPAMHGYPARLNVEANDRQGANDASRNPRKAPLDQ